MNSMKFATRPNTKKGPAVPINKDEKAGSGVSKTSAVGTKKLLT